MKKKIKDIYIWEKKQKYLFLDDMILYIENLPKEKKPVRTNLKVQYSCRIQNQHTEIS